MSITARGRRARYDNISVGNAAGKERLIAGDTVSVVSVYGGGVRTSTSTGECCQTNIKVGTSTSDRLDFPENPIAVGQTNITGENVKVGG